MSQYQVRTGPVVNDAAPFSPEMVQGTRDERARHQRLFLSHQIPLPDSQITHVSAPLSVDMSDGWMPDTPRLPFTAKPGLQISQTTHASAPFTPDMIHGSKPDRARFPFVSKPGLQISQTTPVAAPFSMEMTAGYQPDRARFPFVAKTGLQSSQTTHTDAAFSVEMTAGYGPMSPLFLLGKQTNFPIGDLTIAAADIPSINNPLSPRLPRLWPLGQQISQTTHVAAPFSVEMTAGWLPDKARLPFVSKPGWHVSQLTHVDAPFSLEMVKGWSPDSPQLPFISKPGWQISQTSHVVAPFSSEMSAGWQPSQPRPPFTAKLGWQIYQSTPVQAPFSPEMIAGYGPGLPRLLFGKQTNTPFADLTILVADIPSIINPSSPRLPRLGQWGWQIAQPTHVVAPFSIDMVAVNSPSRPRLQFGKQTHFPICDLTILVADVISLTNPLSPRLPRLRQIGWQIAQNTHVVAPFSPEMVQGWAPNQPRLPFAAKPGVQVSQTTHVSAPFSIEMTAGYQPERIRPPFVSKPGLQISQTSHVPAVFTIDMVLGYTPDRGQLGKTRQIALPFCELVLPVVDVPTVLNPVQPRIFLYPPWGLQLAQLTHVDAPFSIEMVTGYQPERARIMIRDAHKAIYVNAEIATLLSVFHPDLALTLGLVRRIAQAIELKRGIELDTNLLRDLGFILDLTSEDD